jgi:hypothetical protein
MKSAQIIAFKDLLREKFREAQQVREHAAVAATGIAALDAAGMGGGMITEIVSAGAGAGLLLLALAEARGEGVRRLVALVDGADAFDPRAVEAATLERLLWLRCCRDARKAVRVADLLLRDGNLPRVLLDLRFHASRDLRGIPANVWHRLRMLAERSEAALCVFTPSRIVPCARSRLVMEQRFSLDDLDAPREALLARLDGRVERSALRDEHGLAVING